MTPRPNSGRGGPRPARLRFLPRRPARFERQADHARPSLFRRRVRRHVRERGDRLLHSFPPIREASVARVHRAGAAMITLLVTFTAIVLGLLTTSVKAGFDAAYSARGDDAAQLAQLDRCLRDYGPETAPIREQLRGYVAAVIASTWPDEPRPVGVAFPDPAKMPRIGGIAAPVRRLERGGARRSRASADRRLPQGSRWRPAMNNIATSWAPGGR